MSTSKLEKSMRKHPARFIFDFNLIVFTKKLSEGTPSDHIDRDSLLVTGVKRLALDPMLSRDNIPLCLFAPVHRRSRVLFVGFATVI